MHRLGLVRFFALALALAAVLPAACSPKDRSGLPGGGGTGGTGGMGSEVSAGGAGGVIDGSTVDSTSEAAVTSTGSGSYCDVTGECGGWQSGCIACSTKDGGPCGIEGNNCKFDADCQSIVDCVATCISSLDAGDPNDCVNSCENAYPNAQPLYELARNCYCSACATDCAAGCY